MLGMEKLRALCIKNNWFTCGSVEQYEKLFRADRLEVEVHDIALIIWICSDGASITDIEFQLLNELEGKEG